MRGYLGANILGRIIEEAIKKAEKQLIKKHRSLKTEVQFKQRGIGF